MEKRFGIVVKGLIMREGRALIVRRSDYSGISDGCWECPGGRVEFGEAFLDAMRREAMEETGLKISVDRLLNASSFMPNADIQMAVLTYLCHSPEGEVSLSNEHTDYCWADCRTFRRLMIPSVLGELEAAGALLAAGLCGERREAGR